MTQPDILTFDIEIRNKVPDKNEPPNPQFRYCQGWKDHAGMGISFLGAHCSWTRRVTFFDESNILDFMGLVAKADIITGYNIVGFDIGVLKATLERLGHDTETGMKGKIYDPLGDIRQTLRTQFPKGWTLDNVVKSTLGAEKSGDGAMAPELWQKGRYAELINYLYQDVFLEASLFQHIWKNGFVKNNFLESPQPELHLLGIERWKQQFPG